MMVRRLCVWAEGWSGVCKRACKRATKAHPVVASVTERFPAGIFGDPLVDLLPPAVQPIGRLVAVNFGGQKTSYADPNALSYEMTG